MIWPLHPAAPTLSPDPNSEAENALGRLAINWLLPQPTPRVLGAPALLSAPHSHLLVLPSAGELLTSCGASVSSAAVWSAKMMTSAK